MTTSEKSRGRTVRCAKCSREFQIELARSPAEITEFQDDSAGLQRRNELVRRWLWGIGALFILLSLGSLSSFPLGLSFPFLLIAGLSLLPPVWQLAEEWWAVAENHGVAIRGGLVMLAIAVTGLLAPISGNTNAVSDAAQGPRASSADARIAKEERAAEKANKLAPSSAVAKTTSATPHVNESYRIEVESLIVKRIGKKHRYFFQIRNDDSRPFNGKVEVRVKGYKGVTVGLEVFVFKAPLEPGKATYGFIDANTGPTSRYGDFKVTSFQYRAYSQQRNVASGTGSISQKYEEYE
jgi:hypothetical protein